MVQNKRIVFGFCFSVAVLALAVTSFLTPFYRNTTSVTLLGITVDTTTDWYWTYADVTIDTNGQITKSTGTYKEHVQSCFTLSEIFIIIAMGFALLHFILYVVIVSRLKASETVSGTVRSVTIVSGILVVATSLVAVFAFLSLPTALTADFGQCGGMCTSFAGEDHTGGVAVWGPSVGWVMAIAAGVLAIVSTWLAWMVHQVGYNVI